MDVIERLEQMKPILSVLRREASSLPLDTENEEVLAHYQLLQKHLAQSANNIGTIAAVLRKAAP